MKTKRSTMILVGLSLSLIGIGLLCLGLCLTSSYLKKSKTYIETKGVVVAFEVKGGYDDDVYDNYFYEDVEYAPIVKYIVDGRVYEKTHNVYSNNPEYLIGQPVTLKYNPNNPEDVIFKFNTGYWIIFLVGGVFTLCGLPMTFVGIFKYKKNIGK